MEAKARHVVETGLPIDQIGCKPEYPNCEVLNVERQPDVGLAYDTFLLEKVIELAEMLKALREKRIQLLSSAPSLIGAGQAGMVHEEVSRLWEALVVESNLLKEFSQFHCGHHRSA